MNRQRHQNPDQCLVVAARLLATAEPYRSVKQTDPLSWRVVLVSFGWLKSSSQRRVEGTALTEGMWGVYTRFSCVQYQQPLSFARSLSLSVSFLLSLSFLSRFLPSFAALAHCVGGAVEGRQSAGMHIMLLK